MALINDCEVVARGLAAMLRSCESRIEVIQLDPSASSPSRVDIALYDIFAQESDDPPTVADLVAHPAIDRVVVYAWHVEDHLVRSARKAGAAGYLTKDLPAPQLITALCAVRAGRAVFPKPRLRVPSRGAGLGRDGGLTTREAQILSLIAQGMSNREIVGRLGLSINSIKSYIRTGYRKIDVTTRSQAVLWAVENGLRADGAGVVEPVSASAS